MKGSVVTSASDLASVRAVRRRCSHGGAALDPQAVTMIPTGRQIREARTLLGLKRSVLGLQDKADHHTLHHARRGGRRRTHLDSRPSRSNPADIGASRASSSRPTRPAFACARPSHDPHQVARSEKAASWLASLRRISTTARRGRRRADRPRRGRGRHGDGQEARPRAIQGALETAGVEFIPENDGGAGVRLRKGEGGS